jgi:hypothetical protein
MNNQTTMKNTNFQVQFWHGAEAVWKPAGLRIFSDLDEAKKVMKAQAEMTGHMVDFRIEEVA